MVKGLYESAWKRANWETVMIPALKGVGFDYEKFPREDQHDWQSVVIKILDGKCKTYNYYDATAVMFFFLAQEFQHRMIKGMNAKDYLTTLGIAYIHENHTLVNSFVADLIEDENYETIYKYRSTKSKITAKIQDLTHDKKEIKASLSSLKKWSMWLLLPLVFVAGTAFYVGQQQTGYNLFIVMGLILAFSLIRGGILSNKQDALDKKIKELSTPKTGKSNKLIFVIILVGIGVLALFHMT